MRQIENLEVTWDMRQNWYALLGGLIGAAANNALGKNVEGLLDCLEQLHANSWWEYEKEFSKEDIEKRFSMIRTIIYNSDFYRKTDRTSTGKKQNANNQAFEELVKLQKEMLGAMAKKNMFMKKERTYSPDEAILQME